MRDLALRNRTAAEAFYRAGPDARAVMDAFLAWRAGRPEGSPKDFTTFARDRAQHIERPQLSELLATEQLAGAPGRPRPGDIAMGLRVLKSPIEVDPKTGASRNQPNVAGSDIVGVTPEGRIVYADDKALRERPGQTVERAPAIVQNLAENMAADAALFQASIDRRRALGEPVEAWEQGTVNRIRDCAAELATLGYTSKTPLSQIAANPTDFRTIIQKYRVDLVVTSAAGLAADVNAALRALGVRFVR
jgi:hypothetical protein